MADEKTVLAGHNGGIPCSVFRPDGRLLATGGKDSEVRFWDTSTGQLVESMPTGEKVQTLAFSADGRQLAVGCMGRTGAPHLRIVDVQSNETIHEAKPAMGNVHSLAWADGNVGQLLAGCGPKGVALWKVLPDKPLQLERVFELDRFWSLATILDANGRWMVWTQDDLRPQAWDILRRQEKQLHAPSMLQGWHGVAFLPDGESIIYVTRTGVAEVWNVQDDRHVASFGEPGTFNAPHIALSPDGKWLAALTEPDSVSIWNLPTGEHVYSLRPEAGTVWSLAWDPSSEQLAVGRSDGGLAVWHLVHSQETD